MTPPNAWRLVVALAVLVTAGSCGCPLAATLSVVPIRDRRISAMGADPAFTPPNTPPLPMVPSRPAPASGYRVGRAIARPIKPVLVSRIPAVPDAWVACRRECERFMEAWPMAAPYAPNGRETGRRCPGWWTT